jgi:hypothetical protein
MAVRSIQARCRRCGDDFTLADLLDDRRGVCLRCGWPLTHDWTPKLLGDAARAEAAQRQLVSALRSLRNLPGNVVVRPHTVLRNLFDEVGWQRDLAEDPELLREELRELRRALLEWELLDPVLAAERPRLSWLQRAAAWFTRLPLERTAVPTSLGSIRPEGGPAPGEHEPGIATSPRDDLVGVP